MIVFTESFDPDPVYFRIQLDQAIIWIHVDPDPVLRH